MTPQDRQRAASLSRQVASIVPRVPQKTFKKVKSVKTYNYKSLGGKQAPWQKSVPSPYSKTLSQRIKNLGTPRTEKVIEKPVYLGKPGDKGVKGDKGDNGRNGEDGATPVKGIHYFTEQEVNDIKNQVKEEVLPLIPKNQEPIRVDLELAKQIVALMHLLPEQDKLEVSKGIRNAQSFIFAKTKYQTSELMHGAGSSGTSVNNVYGEVLQTQDPTGQVFTLAHTPVVDTVRLYRGGAYQILNVDYTISGATITLTYALQSGETLVADYSYA